MWYREYINILKRAIELASENVSRVGITDFLMNSGIRVDRDLEHGKVLIDTILEQGHKLKTGDKTLKECLKELNIDI